MRLYRISNWGRNFENNRTRTVSELSWVRIPNRFDGENFSGIVSNSEGAIIFAGFVLMVELASKCEPRGTLVRGNGRPHTPATIAAVTRAPQKWFEKSIEYLENRTDWLEYQEVADDWQRDVSGLPPNWQATAPREEKIREDKTPETLVFQFPVSFTESTFKPVWDQWVDYRKKFKKPKCGWQSMFNQQLQWLGGFGEATAVSILGTSLRNGWQGLFEPKNQARPPKSDKPW